jgi:hypothetical protein
MTAEGGEAHGAIEAAIDNIPNMTIVTQSGSSKGVI